MILEAVIKIVCVVAVMLLMVAYMILAERKVAAWVQDRIGPNRAGPRGLIQPFCDGLKLLFKEDYTPAGVEKVLFILAPCILMGLAVAAIAVIPFGGDVEIAGKTVHLQIARVNIGILYVLALSSLSVYGIVIGGWSSNNKYSLYGGIRAAAQLLSYEIPLTLSVLTLVMLSGTLRLEEIVAQQSADGWFVLRQPLVFIVFLVCIFAETNRLPFDLPECEQELVGGYHTEYSSMKFGLFFLGEYAHMIVASSLAVVLFFGGWHLPFITSENATAGAAVLRIVVFIIKVWIFILFYMWVRWSLPRFRFDQIMSLAWKSLIPLATALLVVNALIIYFTDSGIWQLAGNIAVFVLLLLILAVKSYQPGAGNAPLTDITAEAQTS